MRKGTIGAYCKASEDDERSVYEEVFVYGANDEHTQTDDDDTEEKNAGVAVHE